MGCEVHLPQASSQAQRGREAPSAPHSPHPSLTLSGCLALWVQEGMLGFQLSGVESGPQGQDLQHLNQSSQ